MTQITITNSSPVNQYQYAGTNAILRIWYSRNFVDSLGNVVIGGDPGYYQAVACTVNPSTHILTIPSFVLTSTTDAQELGATITGQIFDQSHTPRNVIFSQWSLSPAGGTTLLFANWAIYNNPTSILFPPFFTLTRDQIVALIGNTPGISSLNGLTPAAQTFATGTAGTNFAISSSGSVHTFNLPTASASNRGLLASADWAKFDTGTSNTAVTPGSYTAANITVNSRGQLTAAANGSASGSVTSIAASGGVETTTGTPITSTGTIRGTERTNAQTGTLYALSINDRGWLITSTNVAPVAFGFAPGSLGNGFYCDIQNNGTSTLTLTPSSGTINGAATLVLGPREGGRLCIDSFGNAAMVLGTAHLGVSATSQLLYNNAGSLDGITNATTDGIAVRMVSPKLVTAIVDTNSNNILDLGATASAVNRFGITNAAALSSPVLSAIGSDPNINILVTPKGSGRFQLPNTTILTFGGQTSSFHGIKGPNTGSGILIVKADDSALAPLLASVCEGVDGLKAGELGTEGAIFLTGSHFAVPVITIQTSSSLTTSWTWELPVNDGDTGQFLQTDGTGVTSWQPAKSLLSVLPATTLVAGTFFTCPADPTKATITTEANVAFVMGAAGIIRHLYLRTGATAAVGTPATVITVRKNGVDTTLTATLSLVASTSSSDTAHSVSFSQGDILTIKIVVTGAGTSANLASISMEYDSG